MAKQIGKYRIDQTLGQGGMGLVYKAWDTSLERAVALKTIIPQLASSEEIKQRLLREAKSAAQLQHPNVVTVYEFGEIDGQLFIAMEYIRGHSLGEELRKGESLERKIQIMAQTCKALAYAHKAGIVHRDVKPSNIYIDEDGNVKLLDFGIAQVANSELTRTGLTMGTPEYMSPEMVDGGEVDHRSDIFSCGVVFYELLTALKPFKHERLTTTLYNITHLDPPPFPEHSPLIPEALEKIVFGMLSKDVAERFQSLEQVTAELEQLQSQFLMAKALKAQQLTQLLSDLEEQIRQVSGGEAGRRLVEQRFGEDLTEARSNVGRLSKASNTSISLEMVESELENVKALHERIADFAADDFADRVQRVVEPTRRLNVGEEIPLSAEVPAEAALAAPAEAPEGAKGPRERNRFLRPVLAGVAGIAIILLLWIVLPGSQGGDPSAQHLADGAETSSSTDANRDELSQRMRAAYEEGLVKEIGSLAAQLKALGPMTAQELYYQGWALAEERRYKDAIVPLTESLKSAPGNAYARLLLGQSHWRSSGQREPALTHLLQALQQGALTALEEQLARDTILEFEHDFAADHLHARRLGVFGGGKCSGSLVLSKDSVRYQNAEGGNHEILLPFATVGTIVIDEQRLSIRHGEGETLFELGKTEQIAWMEKLLGQIHKFPVTSSDEGTTYQVN